MITKHAQEIEPFVVMEAMERAQQLEAKGEHLIHLEVGEPHFPTPPCIQDAMAKAVKDGMTAIPTASGSFPCERQSRSTTRPDTACGCLRTGSW